MLEYCAFNRELPYQLFNSGLQDYLILEPPRASLEDMLEEPDLKYAYHVRVNDDFYNGNPIPVNVPLLEVTAGGYLLYVMGDYSITWDQIYEE